ncbi:keywimysin-related RiPP [Allorhizocola rhizosphaerae]|nr:keywimysin-related RiPP [Allorhizocola rhizosphaerae]
MTRKAKKTYQSPALVRVGKFRKVTGLVERGTPDLLSHGNIV